MSLSELKDSNWAKTVFQISPVGDTSALDGMKGPTGLGGRDR
jgi:hypothetical protein